MQTPMQAPAPPPEPAGTLQDFWEQPGGGGGPSLSWPHPGVEYAGTVIRDVTRADLIVQTDLVTKAVQKFPDGRVKRAMKVMLNVQPSPQFPEGKAAWYVKGADRDELVRAMQEAGAGLDADGNPQAPRQGDFIHIAYTHDQPSRAGNPSKVKRIRYIQAKDVPPGMAPQQPGVVQGQVVQSQYAQPAPGTQYMPPNPVQYAQQPQPGYQAMQGQFPLDPAQAYQQATGQPVQQPAPAGPPNGYGAQAYQAGPAYQQPQQVPTPPPGYPNQSQQYAQQPQQFPTPAQPAPAGPPSAPAQPSGAPSPSNGMPAAPDGSPWPPDVPFIPGLTPDQARLAVSMQHPAAQSQQ